MIEFKKQLCSACNKRSVTVSTEILSVDPVTKAIKKVYLFRCEMHLRTSVSEMFRLREMKNCDNNFKFS